jgi:hypothetical protein
MKKLEDMSIGHRVMLTVAIVVILLILLAAFGYVTGRWEEASAEVVVGPSKYDDRIDALERQAIEEAFKKHISQLYSIWVTDNYQPRIPPKATIGARNARDAYIRSMDAIERREQTPLPAPKP